MTLVTAQEDRKSARGDATPSDALIYREIYAAIVEHRLAPGTKLTEGTLARLFGVSRTPVAKALQRLCHDKIATSAPNRGVFVARPSVNEAREVFAARRLIESEIFQLAANSASAQDLAALERLVSQERRAQSTPDPAAVIQLSGRFHLSVAEMAGNATLALFLGELVARTSLIIAVYQRLGESGCNDHDHEDLVALLTAGEGGKAARRVRHHLRALEKSLSFGQRGQTKDLVEAFPHLAAATLQASR